MTTEFIDTVAVEVGGQNLWSSPELRIKGYRCFTEPILSYQFGEEIMDKLFNKAEQILVEDYKQGKEATKNVSVVVVLKKKEI